MAESLVSFAAQHIETMIDEESNSLWDVELEAKELQNELKQLEKFLLDAQRNKELDSNEQVRAWWAEMGKIACDAEDVLDNFVTETESTVFSSMMKHGFCRSSRVQQASKKLRKIREQMLEVKTRLHQYEQEHGEGSSKGPRRKLRAAHVRGALALQAHRHADDDFVVGINDDLDRLVRKLLGISNGDHLDHGSSPSSQKPIHIDVLAIVGMGGSGKSTLARKIYNHRMVREHFEYQAWFPLSQEWEWDVSHEIVLVSEILTQLDGSSSSNNLKRFVSQIADHDLQSYEFDEILVQKKWQLQNLLSTKACLVVLDDVWHLESVQQILHTLLIPHQGNDHVSTGATSNTKIVITSRQNLQLLPPNYTHLKWDIHYTRFLNEEDSWKLFNEVSRSKSGNELAREYRGLAMEMLGTCKGLPLAIVALGRLLKTKDSIQEWERVFSHLRDEEGPYLYRPVKDILALSYDELPYYLKPCFLYLGLLAEDSTISAGTLTRMWIAEGFVKQRESGETPEAAARRLLQELVDHTMVQAVTKTYANKVKTLRVHDLMRDLCIMKAREVDFLTIFSSDIDQGTGAHARRAVVNLRKCSTFPINNSHLRSLMLTGQSGTGIRVGEHGNKVSQLGKLDLILVTEKFKLLRVLDVNGIKTSDGTMPKEIGSLIHLRYLRIRGTNIRELPKSIGKLRKLLTLDYWEVSSDTEIKLPNVLWKLERLRHLFLPGEMMSNTHEDLKLDTLKELRTLSGIKGGNWMLKEMKTLSSTLTKLCIQGISSPAQLNAVFDCPAIIRTETKMGNLYALDLDWYGFSLESLSALLLESNLEKLKLMGRAPDESKPMQFPASLRKLELYYTHLEQEETLDALGELPELKFLGLAKDSFIGRKWICREKTFTSLEELKLSNLPKLEEWEIRGETMRCLKKLSIVACANLKQMPEGLQSISTLETLEIERMPTTFNSRFRKVKAWNDTTIGGEDSEIIKLIPNVRIRDSCPPLF